MFNTFIEPLEAEFGITSNHRIGRFSDVSKSQEYTDRIEAINFALAHDDGQSAKNLAEADVILVGVSRSGKTPTSLYLAMQHGIKAANYPLIPEDFERGRLPSTLAPFKAQVLRPDDRPRAAGADPQRAPAEQQVRVDRELPLRGARGRDDDEARRHRLAVVDAQVDRGDRDDDPARPAAGPAGVLSERAPRRADVRRASARCRRSSRRSRRWSIGVPSWRSTCGARDDAADALRLAARRRRRRRRAGGCGRASSASRRRCRRSRRCIGVVVDRVEQRQARP